MNGAGSGDGSREDSSARPHGKPVSMGAWAVLAYLLGTMILHVVAADPTPTASAQPRDLTGMSLEELLHEEITPINVLGGRCP